MPIVVDSSVWIDYFNGQATTQTDSLDQILGTQEIIVGDFMLTEVLQGFRKEKDFKQARDTLSQFTQVTMLGPSLAIKSAENFRQLRKKGVTVRKTIDVMIATFCIEHCLPLLHTDQDFTSMGKYLGLTIYA